MRYLGQFNYIYDGEGLGSPKKANWRVWLT